AQLAIAFQVKIDRTWPNAIATGGNRYDGLPSTVQEWSHHHDRQAIRGAECQGYLGVAQPCGLDVQSTRGAFLKLGPKGFTNGTRDLAIADRGGIMKNATLLGQHGRDHELGDRIFRTAESYLTA